MLEDLKVLRRRMKPYMQQLTKIHPYAPYFLDMLNAQIRLNPGKKLMEIWLCGGNDLLVREISSTLDRLEDQKKDLDEL